MPILAASELHLAYGERTLFDGDSISIEPGDRVGIVGPNGTGKSTLLQILAERLVPDGGKLVRAKGCRLGYLSQEIGGEPLEGKLVDSVLETAPGRDSIEARLAEVERALERSTDEAEQMTLAEELAFLHEELADLDRVFGQHQTKRILRGLGFDESDFDRPIRELSGGWRMRAHLAALLFQRPDVLLLDEPTNHLDMPSVNWLSTFIRGSKHAIVLTCHDKEFLNRHVRRIASLEVEGLTLFRGNYDEYLTQRAINLEFLERRIAKDDQRRKELEAFVERFKAKATKARQAQSRVRMIEKLEEQHVDLPKVRQSISIRFAPTARSGDIVLRTKRLEHGFGERTLFDGLDLVVRRGERVALVGRNGAGKTTLLKLLASELTPRGGAIELGQNVTTSYFAQHHAESLSPGRTILEEVWGLCPTRAQTEVRGLCGAFLFSGDDVEKKIGVLSGGEKTRVALARILIEPQNLLLLDEPTNHLDTESAEKLTDSLMTFDGTMIFVSHNLDFARRLSTIVWNVDRGHVQPFPGSLADYLEDLTRMQAERDAELEEKASVDPAKAARIESRKKKSDLDRKLSSLEKKIEKEEQRIASLEKEKADLEERLANPETHADLDRSRSLASRYADVQQEIEAALERWSDLGAERESI